jgi:RNA polymerase sigma-70 factor, ECF subfamily
VKASLHRNIATGKVMYELSGTFAHAPLQRGDATQRLHCRVVLATGCGTLRKFHNDYVSDITDRCRSRAYVYFVGCDRSPARFNCCVMNQNETSLFAPVGDLAPASPISGAFAAQCGPKCPKRKIDSTTRNQVLETVPSLRAFAMSLCKNSDFADDLVQETLSRALTHMQSFEPGTNMQAWLFTILRNEFRAEFRKRRREVEDREGRYADRLKTQPEQLERVEFEDLRTALGKLPLEQREALILVSAAGLSYDEAAAICGCPVGTVKSRINRARTRLAQVLSVESADDFGPDSVTRAVLAVSAVKIV